MRAWAGVAPVFGLAAVVWLALAPAGEAQIRPTPATHQDVVIQAAPAGTIPCNPVGPPAGSVTITPTGVTSNDPNIDVTQDQTVSTPANITSDFPGLNGGVDSGLAKGVCNTSFDISDQLPPMNPPAGPDPGQPPAPPIPPVIAHVPQLTFIPPPVCRDVKGKPHSACGMPLNCNLPFCGRDVIFVHGFVNEAMGDVIAAHLLGGSTRSLASWPAQASDFVTPGGYYHDKAYDRWNNLLINKLGPAYKAAGASEGPRFLIVAWAAHQRMQVADHAVLSQIATAIQTGAGVMTLDLSQPGTPVVPSGLTGPGFCAKGCILVSQSTGGPIALTAMRIAANGGPSWWTPSLQVLPKYMKGHLAFHPAFVGSQLSFLALALANPINVVGCGNGVGFANLIGGGPWIPSGVNPCAALAELDNSVMVDLMPFAMNLLWRPTMQATPGNPDLNVPTVVVAGANPAVNPLGHWVNFILPGDDDGVVSVDSQMGRQWSLGAFPRTLSLNSWGLLGVRYFDRGSETLKAVAYYVDQNMELGHFPGHHAAAPNPYLLPTGMIMPDVGLNQVPSTSTDLHDVYSFLQSTSSHYFPRFVGSSDPASTSNGCNTTSYNYREVGLDMNGIISGWPTDPVGEESRAVFDPGVYTNLGRNLFPAETATGTIPLLSTRLQNDVEGEVRGRFITLRFRLLHITKTFWLWRREYIRMANWRCKDEVDYAFDYAFRR